MTESSFFADDAYLLHRTIETGDERRSYLTEVSGDTIEMIQPILDDASEQGDTPFQIGTSQWWVTAHPAREGDETRLPGFSCGNRGEVRGWPMVYPFCRRRSST